MLGKSVLLHTADRVGACNITRALRAAGNEVARTDSVSATVDLIGAGVVDLVLLDDHDAAARHTVLERARNRLPVVLLSSLGDPAALFDLVHRQQARHLLLRCGDGDRSLRRIDPREVMVTVEKILRRDIFGIGKYLPEFGVEISVCDIHASTDRAAAIGAVKEFLVSLGAGRQLAATMGLVADELTANAVYHAPRDPAGNPRYPGRDRRRPLVLSPPELVRVRFASDGTWFVLSVTDRCGSLRAEQIGEALARGHACSPGAGRGLYTALQSSGQLVFNLEPGVKTEVIAIVDLSRRMRGLRQDGHSLHLFTVEPPAVPRALAAIPSQKVMLSDSLRIDLRSELAAVRGEPAALALLRPKFSAPVKSHPSRRPEVRPPLATSTGLDTFRALLRGAGTAQDAMTATLRFLNTDYRTVVGYTVERASLEPWLAAGKLRDWTRLGGLAISRSAASTPGWLADRGGIRALRPERHPIDARMTELASGAPDDVALGFAVEVGGAVRYVVCGFAPRFARLIHRAILTEIRSELADTLARIDRSLGRTSSSDWDEPYDEIAISSGRATSEPPYAGFELTTGP